MRNRDSRGYVAASLLVGHAARPIPRPVVASSEAVYSHRVPPVWAAWPAAVAWVPHRLLRPGPDREEGAGAVEWGGLEVERKLREAPH